MAVAFYIPDQEELRRKSEEQEQQILRIRRLQWKLIATLLLDLLKRFAATEFKSSN